MLPNKNDFIERVVSEITESYSIPVKLKKDRIEGIIASAIQKFKERDEDCTQVEYIILQQDVFRTELFKERRQVLLPDCVHAITDLRTIGNRDGWYNNINPDYRKTNFSIYYDSFTGPNHSTKMLTAVGESYYRNFISNFTLNSVSYRYNEFSRTLTVTGRDPYQSLVAEAHVYVTEGSFFNMSRFFEYVCGKCRVSFANIIGFTNIPRIGGINLNLQEIKEQGKEQIAEVEEFWKGQLDTLAFYINEN